MTDYGQLEVVWGEDVFAGDFDLFFAGQVNGLAGASSGTGLYLSLGRRSGGSPVLMVLLDGELGPPAAEWEDVVEVSVTIPPGVEVGWCMWATESYGPLGLPAGSYRVRVNATGRDVGFANELASGAVDRYLVEFWPATAARDAILRTTTANAEYWHGEVGSRR